MNSPKKSNFNIDLIAYRFNVGVKDRELLMVRPCNFKQSTTSKGSLVWSANNS